MAIQINVAFPMSGEQDCFADTVGSPFIAFGTKPGGGFVVTGARLLYHDGTNLINKVGEVFAFADFQVSGGYLTAYGAHKPIVDDENTNYGADTHWAVAFPDVEDLPADTDLFLIVRAASFNETSEKVVRFRHVPPEVRTSEKA